MRLSSPSSARRGDASGLLPRSVRKGSGRDGASVRGPALHLHFSPGSIAWAVATGGGAPELLRAGTVVLGRARPGAALAELVADELLPVTAARVAISGRVAALAPDTASAPALPPSAAVIELDGGRVLHAELDLVALDEVLAACAEAGVEVVGAEPEALPLARSLAAPSPGLAPGAPVAVVWRSPSAVLVACCDGGVTRLLGSRPLGPETSPLVVAAVVAGLLADAGCAEAVVAGSDQAEAALLAPEVAAAAGIPARLGDPLARIRCAEDAPVVAGPAAGAIGLAIDARGLPRVEIPVRMPRPGAARSPALAPLPLAEPAAPAAAPAPAPEPLPEPAPAPAPAADTGSATEPLAAPAPAPAPAAAAASAAAPTAPGRPAAPVRGTRRGRLVATVVAAAVVSGVLVGVWVLAERAEVRDRKAVLATLQTQLAAIPSPTAPTRRLLVLGADRRARVDAIADALGSRVAWDRVLREVSAVLPADIWLTALSASAATPAPATGEPVRLEGYARDQAAVALALSRLALLPDLADVRLVRSARATVSGTQVVRFAIVAGVRREGG